uniref:Uncharacterized protein n=1 Tax=Triticum urartu TaxID=4572 RepID=A0A8R7VFV6_TRIUA
PHLLRSPRRRQTPHVAAAFLPPTGHLPLQTVRASPLRLLLASLGDAPAATPPHPRWEVLHQSVQRSKPTARGRSPSQHPFPAAIVRCSVQLLQPTRVIALFATTAAAQTRAWSSSNRFLTQPPRKPCSCHALLPHSLLVGIP